MSTTTKLFDKVTLRKPDYYPQANQFIDALHSSFWTSLKWTFQSAASDYRQKLTPAQQQVVSRSLSAIAQVEIPVKTFWTRIGETLRHPGISDLGTVIANSEVVHGKTYNKLIDVLDLNELFNQNLKTDQFSKRIAYLTKWSEKSFKDDKQQFIYSLCLFSVFSEYVSLFSQFYTLASIIREHNVLKELEAAVSYTSAEEHSHYLVGQWLIQTLRKEYPELFDEKLEEKIREEVLVALKAEYRLIDFILGDYKGKNLDAALLKTWIYDRFIRGLEGVGFKGLLPELTEEDHKSLVITEWFDDFVFGQRQSDFFVVKPTEYAVANKSFEEEDVF